MVNKNDINYISNTWEGFDVEDVEQMLLYIWRINGETFRMLGYYFHTAFESKEKRLCQMI